jgi:hypothetical protein
MDFVTQAMEAPFSRARTFGMSVGQGFNETVAGTAIREGSLPPEAPTAPGIRIEMGDGTVRIAPDTPQVARRRTIFGTPETVRNETLDELQQRRGDAGAIDLETYKQSRFYRDGIPWDRGMTEGRAAALADAYDRRKVMDFYASKRPYIALAGGVVGQAADPINYIPMLGPTARGTGIAVSAARAAVDAMASTALFSTATMDARNRLGDEVTFGDVALDIAGSAIIGSAFGALGGAVGKYRANRADARSAKAVADRVKTIQTINESRVPLADAVQAMAAGRPVQLGPNSTAIVDRVTAKVAALLDERASTVVTPTGTRVQVRQEIVDASELVAASGDLQPRDRSRAASDAQIARMASELDPSRLLPAPEADRGAPIVGPDNVVESGNGRVAALRLAAEQHPERFEAYKRALKQSGYDVPEDGVPVLISRRVSDLSPADRIRFVGDSNTSSIARMSSTETAMMDVRAMTDNVIDAYQPGDTFSAANRPFVSGFIRNLPENERASLVDAAGQLNADGVRRIERALLATAYGDAPTVARFSEAVDDNTKSITGALTDAAGQWATLKRLFDARELDADLDVTANLLEALKVLSKARADAASQSRTVSRVLAETMAQTDIFTGDFNRRVKTILEAFYTPDFGRAKSRNDVADFLGRLATETEAAGKPQLFDDALTADDILTTAARGGRPKGGLFDAAGPGVRDNRAGAAQVGAGNREQGISAAGRPAEGGTGTGAAAETGRIAELTPQDFYRQPFEAVDDLYAVAPLRQAELDEVGKGIGRDLDAEYRTRGIKERTTAEAKIARKGYKGAGQLTDVVRGAFVVDTPAKAEAVLAGLAERFDVLDEGWLKTREGYFDRKALIRFKDGTIGEVQLWEPTLLAAKKAGGHKLYKQARELPNGSAEQKALTAQMQELYSAAAAKAGSGWSSVGSSPSAAKLLKRLRQAPSDIMPAVWDTSMKSTLTQSASGERSALASVSPSTAGRLSQFTKSMVDTPTGNIAPEQAANNEAAELSGTISEPETMETLAQQHGVDPVTGDFAEAADLAQVEAEGRLTDADRQELADADKTFENGTAYDDALQAAVRCFL